MTALGETAVPWEERARSLGSLAESRLRYGEPYGKSAILAEARRPGLSAADVKTREAELVVSARRSVPVTWATFGASLDPALSELSRLLR